MGNPKVPYTKRYENATKVNEAPKGEGWSGGEQIGNKTYYDKTTGKAIAGGTPGSDWHNNIVNQLQSGVSPENLVKQGHIDPSRMEEFRQYYKPVYTEQNQPTAQPKTLDTLPKFRADRTINYGASTPFYTAYNYPSNSGGQTQTKFFGSPTGSKDISQHTHELDPSNPGTYDAKNNFVPNIIQGSYGNQGANLGTINATGKYDLKTGTEAPIPTNDTGNPIISSTPVRMSNGTEIPTSATDKANLNTLVTKGMKRGGLVGKTKGYDDGGTVTPPSKVPLLTANQQNGLVGQTLNGAANITDSLTTDVYGRRDTGSQAGDYAAGIGSGLVKGAAAGAMFGPIGMGVGAGIGAITGGIKTFGDEKAKKAQIDAANQAKSDEDKRQAGLIEQTSINKQIQDRGFKMGGLISKTNCYSNGGKIEGKGTGTSDSIKATVEDGSFVVPAKNVPMIKKILPSITKKKANINQTGETKVKLSNGEVLLDPNQKEKLQEAGVNLNKFAPDADDKIGYKDGGEVKKKALQKAISDYQTAVATKASNPLYTDADVKKYKDAVDAATADYKASIAPTKTIAKGNPTMDASYTGGAYKPSVMADKTGSNNQTSTPTKAFPRYSNNALLKNKVGVQNNLLNPITSNIPSNAEPQLKNSPATDASFNEGNDNNNATTSKGNKFDYGNLINQGQGLVSNLANYVIPRKQVNMGLNFLASQGKRPEGQIDPAFQDSVNKANINAQYGFTPEQTTQINNQNVDALNEGRAAARNYSGGSASNAYQGERDAANQYYQRGLGAKIADKNLQLDKQMQVNSMNLDRANMATNLFNQHLQGWKENQLAGSSLVHQGLSNEIGAKIYNDEINMEKQRNSANNNWLNI